MSKHYLAPILLGFLVIGAPLRAEAPQDEMVLNLTCKPPSFKVRTPPVTFTGTCPLPSGVVLRISLQRIAETLAGVQLEPNLVAAGGGNAEIEDKRFSFTSSIEGPGKYMAQISFPPDLQEQNHLAEVQKKTGTKGFWPFEFLLWNDDLVPLLSTKLLELNALVGEVRDLLKRMEAATVSEQAWASAGAALVPEGLKLSNKVQNSDLKALYPAAMGNLYFTIRNVAGAAKYFTFADGKFGGAKDYHADNKKVSTFRGEDFTWDNLKRYVEETSPCAGREFALWIVKDLRRTAGQMRPEIQEALKQQKASPGVDIYFERLLKATISDLDALEADIRGKKAGAAPKEGEMKK